MTAGQARAAGLRGTTITRGQAERGLGRAMGRGRARGTARTRAR